MLNWAQHRFSIFSWLDSNEYQGHSKQYECLLAIAGNQCIHLDTEKPFDQLREFHLQHPGWLFGHLQYPSSKPDDIGFPKAFFFVPDIVLTIKDGTLTIESTTISAEHIANEILEAEKPTTGNPIHSIEWHGVTSKETYLNDIRKVLTHIQRGDCYELNYCMEYRSKVSNLNPIQAYFKLAKTSPNPFSAFYRINQSYALCASPERFIQRMGNTVLSEPIKGTAKRNLLDPEADQAIMESLKHHPKERSENIMVVDLVRNDLSKIATRGSVHVRELCELYSFPHVHHLISSIEASVEPTTHWTTILEASFPMGSMTGAPKKRVMELIEQYEATPRSLFSGTIGYINPEGNFDFNVVIRSIFYHETSQLLSCKVGSGITINSKPEDEYEECLAKIDAIKSVFS